MDRKLTYSQIGERIRNARHAAEMSQDALAQVINVSRPSIANIEAGRQRIAAHVLIDIAAALKVEPAVLIQEAATPDHAYASRAFLAEARVKELQQLIDSAKERAAALFV